MSEKAPLQDRLGKRWALRRTGVQLGDGRLVLGPERRSGVFEIIHLGIVSEVVAEIFGQRERRRGKRTAAAEVDAGAAFLFFGRHFRGVTSSVLGRRRRLGQKLADRAMIRRVKPARHRDERDGRAESAGDRRMLHG